MKKYLVVFTLLIFAVTLYGQKTVDFPDLANPSQILVDPENKNFYIADGTTIYIYSLADFHLKLSAPGNLLNPILRLAQGCLIDKYHTLPEKDDSGKTTINQAPEVMERQQ